MDNQLKTFAESAKGLSRTPLGIIALFIVLVYGFATLAVTLGRDMQGLLPPLIYFLVFFPLIVFVGFLWLVSKHHDKIYGPSDFRDEENYLKSQMYAVGMLATASAKSADHSQSASVSSSEINALVEVVTKSFSHIGSVREYPRQILWVDDNPENNRYEREAFQAQGVAVSLATSTAQGLALLKTNKFSAIISDMGRREGPNEGYVLLDKVREIGMKTPFFIYSSSNAPEHTRAAVERGAQGSTNKARELYQMVMKAILNP
jgi:CheY-like chemotaxis protein